MYVLIMRGLPGSGKSHWVNEFKKQQAWDQNHDIMVCSADDYRIVNGVYTFNKENPGEAHAKCLLKFATHLDGRNDQLRSYACLVVDNTNSSVFEIAPYYQLALAYGLDVRIINIQCDFEKAMKRQTHNVPQRTMWHMHQNLMTEVLPAHWQQEFVFN